MLLLRQEYHLDESMLAQYGHFVAGAASFDFGDSIRAHEPVSQLIGSRIAPTLLIVAYAGLISLLVALLFGLYAATHAHGPADLGIRAFGMTAIAVPPFWLGLVLMLLFAIQVPIFATSGYESGLGGVLRTLTLPALTIACGLAPVLVRTIRASVLENLHADYAVAARSRGIGERRVLVHHVLRNSLVATLTVLGTSMAFLVSGTVVVENVFGVPGLGTLTVNAVANRDFPVVQALIVLFAVLTLVLNFCTDVLYGLLDPRVRA